MSQNRAAPAFQEYAATILATLSYKLLNLHERGLFHNLRLELWVNKRLPSKPAILARILGVSALEVENSLPAIMEFFDIVDGFIICPELENYRNHIDERKLRQSKGGKQGSAITNSKRKDISATPSSTPSSKSSSKSSRSGRVLSTVQSSTVKQSQDQLVRRSEQGESFVDSFVAEYEATDNRLNG